MDRCYLHHYHFASLLYFQSPVALLSVSNRPSQGHPRPLNSTTTTNETMESRTLSFGETIPWQTLYVSEKIVWKIPTFGETIAWQKQGSRKHIAWRQSHCCTQLVLLLGSFVWKLGEQLFGPFVQPLWIVRLQPVLLVEMLPQPFVEWQWRRLWSIASLDPVMIGSHP